MINCYRCNKNITQYIICGCGIYYINNFHQSYDVDDKYHIYIYRKNDNIFSSYTSIYKRYNYKNASPSLLITFYNKLLYSLTVKDVEKYLLLK